MNVRSDIPVNEPVLWLRAPELRVGDLLNFVDGPGPGEWYPVVSVTPDPVNRSVFDVCCEGGFHVRVQARSRLSARRL